MFQEVPRHLTASISLSIQQASWQLNVSDASIQIPVSVTAVNLVVLVSIGIGKIQQLSFADLDDIL